jgi:hypothetical protein
MLRVLRTAILVAAASILTACAGAVDAESYGKIKTGMSVKAVENILGSGELQDTGGTGISNAGVVTGNPAPSNLKTYLWKDGNNQIIVEFKDGEVVNKRAVGFEVPK